MRVCMCVCGVWLRGVGGGRTLVLKQLGLGIGAQQGLHNSPLPAWPGCPLQVGKGRAQHPGLASSSSSSSSILVQHPVQHPGPACTPSGQCLAQYLSWDGCQRDVVILHVGTLSVACVGDWMYKKKFLTYFKSFKTLFLEKCRFTCRC